jgi:aspartate/methionine/tyrosine aminotransferase
MQLRLFAADPEEDARINPQHLRKAIRQYGDELCALLLTMPGNPLVAEYSLEELKAIGRVLVQEGVKVIIDSTFDQIQSDYIPLAAVNVELGGQTYPLHEQIVTITGLSKGHNSIGPFKIGVATTGDAKWRRAIEGQLMISFQRETTATARVVIEETTEEYLEKNRRLMMERQQEAKEQYARINEKFGANAVSYLGSSKYGPFMALTFRQDILGKAALEDGWQLADMLLAAVGVKTVAAPRMGFPMPAVRINIDAPRISWKKDPTLLGELFERIEHFVDQILNHGLTYAKAIARIGIESTIGVRKFEEKTRSARLRKIEALAETDLVKPVPLTQKKITSMLVKNGLEVFPVESSLAALRTEALEAAWTNSDYIRDRSKIIQLREQLA